MGWMAALGRISLLVAAAAIIGAIYGYPLAGAAIALVGVILFWQVQMHRVQSWLSDPKKLPPDVYGIWGELSARIYLQQRNHKKVQKRLQSNIDHLQDSLSSMRDGVVMVDEQGSIEWCNAAAGPLLGLRYPEDVGQTLTNLVRQPEFNRYFLAADYSVPLQFTKMSNAGIHLRVEITYFGRGERLLFIRDVSEAVRREQTRRDFVANVSHELRTPLTVISGYLDNFRDNAEQLPETFVRPLEQMSQQAQRMESLLKDLLWLSRIEDEAREAKRESVNVGTIAQKAVEELAAAFPGREVRVEADPDLTILGNYQELYSATSNLVSNALKYGGEQGAVTVRWGREGEHAILAVADTGPGIDEIHLPRLTERFYRVDVSRSTRTGGTGLGLAIVKHVAQVHGAHLQIDSELGVGSTFSLVFPLEVDL